MKGEELFAVHPSLFRVAFRLVFMGVSGDPNCSNFDNIVVFSEFLCFIKGS